MVVVVLFVTELSERESKRDTLAQRERMPPEVPNTRTELVIGGLFRPDFAAA